MSESVVADRPVRHHRSLFLSDLHLGALGSRADLVLDFLKSHLAESYLLVGDIVDLGTPLLSRWSAEHQAVIDFLRKRQDAGARITYVRGNHDPAPEDVQADRRLPVPVVDRAVHVAADGRRYLVIHGDEADMRLLRWHLLTRLGSLADGLLRRVDGVIGQLVTHGNPNRRSAIEALLAVVNRGLSPGRAHERRLADLARGAGCDGVICGHFHIAALRELKGVRYANCGDWTDSFTALVEDFSGRIQLMGGRKGLAAALVPELVRA